MSKQVNPDNFNWLNRCDEGQPVLVVGHWRGNFQGVIKYGGFHLAVITDSSGDDIEVCYMHPIEFHKL